ncbi:TM1802 family CRISPR-associated protein [Thermovirga lienii]|uniref:TM1802 family CRISPR-associated protein n=1 Tax=Thermovirga lienii TaxID=336261 RepID=UPI002FE35D31
MNLDFLDDFTSPHMKSNYGKGLFLAGVVLGVLAYQQAGNNKDEMLNTPLFKQMNFGRMCLRDILNLLTNVPNIIRGYNIAYPGRIMRLAEEAMNLIFMGQETNFDLDVNAQDNAVFAFGFLHACEAYFNKIFPKSEKQETEEVKEQQDLKDTNEECKQEHLPVE